MIANDRAGLHVVRAFQYEFNDLLFGIETPMKVDTMQGLRGLPPIRKSNIQKPGRHGSFPGKGYYSDRVVQWDMWLLTEAYGGDDLIDIIGKSFQLTDTEIPFVMKRPGAERRRLYCKVTKQDIDAGLELSMGYGTASFELTAADPFWYANEIRTKSVDVASGFNSGSINLYNYGVSPTERWHLVIQGPVAAGTNITCAEDQGRQLKLLSGLTTGQTMLIDGYSHDATIYPTYADYVNDANGAPSYNFTRTDSNWFALQPGPNQIVFNRSSTTGTAHLTIHYRDAWSS